MTRGKALGVTLAVAAGSYLTGVNFLHPWQGIRFTPGSDLELGIAVVLAIICTAVCVRRLFRGSSPGAELKRFGDAMDDDAR